jgi:hypothetical protein
MSRGMLVRYVLVVLALLVAYHHERLALHALFVSRGDEGIASTVFTWCGFLVIFPIAVLAARYPVPAGASLLFISFLPATVAALFVPGAVVDQLPRLALYLLPIAVIGLGLLWVGKGGPRKITYLAICGYIEMAVAIVTWIVVYQALRFNGLLVTVGAWSVVTLLVALILERGGWRLLPPSTRKSLPYRA